MTRQRTRATLASLAILPLVLCLGCKSPYIAAVVSNHTGGQVTLIEVDYPSASFGRDVLAEGTSFPYRFKIIGDGPTKVSWTDAAHHNHASTGPTLHEGQHGPLTIELTPAGATWASRVTP